MKAPFPSFTAEWHRSTYATIDPQRPELSAKGKSVIVSGAGSGIGRETVKAFAAAGASRFALLGRTLGTLEETKRIVEAEYPATYCTTYAVNVADETAVHKAAIDIGDWDVLVLNAGTGMKPAPIAETNVLDWWNVMETNLKGAVVAVHAFLPTRSSAASIIGINAGMINIPATQYPATGSSAYITSKIAQVKLLEHVASENPDVFVVSVHPGVVRTALVDSSQLHTEGFVFDDVNLPAHFNVWVTSPEAKFLRGKFVWANWSVPELMARAKEIEETPVLTSNILGWPFQPQEIS
ncbi:hypothetical protein MMC17_002985 [Xylographa soralifera]|nr:hypothetical protein [Xylographa soralifera]